MNYNGKKKVDDVIKLQSKVYLSVPSLTATCKCDICQNVLITRYDDFESMMTMEPINTAAKAVDNDWQMHNKSCYCKTCSNQLTELKQISKELRPIKANYYLNIAREVGSRSTCLRRKYGAIIVKNDTIIATGYNGSPRGTKNCIDIGECKREKLNIPRGQCYEMCRALHAEQNCIINASRNDMIDSDLFLYGIEVDTNNVIENLDSCQLCKKLIINAGIKHVILARPNNLYDVKNVEDWVINDESLTDKHGY